MSSIQQQTKKAVVISSGGLDSTTCMGIAKEAGFQLYPITFDYGQRHRIELEFAAKVAEFYGVSERHRVVQLPFLRELGGSALTDDSLDVPVASDLSFSDDSSIPITYVPARNLLFLSIATSYAEAIGADAIYIGVNALDYSGYPDCRPQFIHAYENIIELATKIGAEGKKMTVEAPLIHWTKAEIIKEGMKIGVPYHMTTSCYNGQVLACGVCDSCRLRLKGFFDAGYIDPIAYE